MGAQGQHDFCGGIVREADLERELAALIATADAKAGLFGPGSAVWQIDREAALFLAAGYALLLQLAHPWVAAAVAEHSRVLSYPIGRFHRTFAFVYAMVFGTPEQALAAARRLHRRHAAISGTLDQAVGSFAAGSRYFANDVGALRWVFATLVVGALAAYRIVNPVAAEVASARYYCEIRRFAAFFGIAQSALPPDWPAFLHYFDGMLASDTIAVGSAARAIAAQLLSGARPWLRPPRWYRALTIDLLPAKLREGFALPLGAAERALAERARGTLRAIYPRLPAPLRHVAPYREACARLAGRPPDSATRIMNRFWIGHSSIAKLF